MGSIHKKRIPFHSCVGDEEAIQNINYLYKQIEDSTLLTVRTLKALFKASGKKFEGQMAASMLQLINEKYLAFI